MKLVLICIMPTHSFAKPTHIVINWIISGALWLYAVLVICFAMVSCCNGIIKQLEYIMCYIFHAQIILMYVHNKIAYYRQCVQYKNNTRLLEASIISIYLFFRSHVNRMRFFWLLIDLVKLYRCNLPLFTKCIRFTKY